MRQRLTSPSQRRGSGPHVEVYSWNPARPVFGGRIGRRLGPRRRVQNFGDLIGPVVVGALLRRRGLDPTSANRSVQLLSVGSVLHHARPGAVVWGSGVNGKIAPAPELLRTLDIRAVRGPRTHRYLSDRGVDGVPAIYGDPALLLPALFPELRATRPTHGVTIVPNLNDVAAYDGHRYLHPRRPLKHCLETIAHSRLVVGSSLHGIIVAEAFGVPARLVRSATEPAFKYDDYYSGTGREHYHAADSVEEALDLGGEPPPSWSEDELVEAFPADLWQPVQRGPRGG
jgi:pyruvyltransferase